MNKLDHIVPLIKRLHEKIRDEIVKKCENTAIDILAKVDREEEVDTIYAIDIISEKKIIEYFEKEISQIASVILIAEGIGKDGQVIFPYGSSEQDAEFRIIMDPIDGTRELMYQKRSAWILTGIAPNKGVDTTLQDIEFAIQTEIPIIKQHLSDVIWAYRGKGIEAHRYNRLNTDYHKINPHPSTAQSIEHGFAMIARFFPGARDVLAQIDDEIVQNILGDVQSGKAHCFEDQYLSTGGQLSELISGHDRFIADLRPLLDNVLTARGFSPGLCCHPYDLCTELIAKEAGVIITDQIGNTLNVKLNVSDNITWIGYANINIRNQVEPFLVKALEKYKLL